MIGKYDDHGEWEVASSAWQLPAASEIDPAMIARVFAKRIPASSTQLKLSRRAPQIHRGQETALERPRAVGAAIPMFCSAARTTLPTKGARRLKARWLALAATTWRHGSAPNNHDLHADGRRGRAVGGHRAIHRHQACVRQPRRRHLLPLGPAGHPAQSIGAKVPSPTRSCSSDAVAMTGGQPVMASISVAR